MRTISLDEEAYQRLKSEKNGNESFSDVVKRLTRPNKKKSLTLFAGKWNLSVEETGILQHISQETEDKINKLI
ncbi:MAG: antitoxin VapB family protein [Candidatus Hodarchaeales archaeon]